MAITAMSCLLNWGLLCVGSADCAVTVYELANQEVCGRITHFEHIPTAIDCFQRSTSSLSDPITVNAAVSNNAGPNGTDGQTVANVASILEETTNFLSIADSSGKVHLVKLHPEFGGSSEVGSKKKNQVLFAESIKVSFDCPSV
jgi:hypothetical protein